MNYKKDYVQLTPLGYSTDECGFRGYLGEKGRRQISLSIRLLDVLRTFYSVYLKEIHSLHCFCLLNDNVNDIGTET